MSQARIAYSGFHDVPLAFVVWHEGDQYLFWRVFDDVLDEYPDTYKVFSLPGLAEDEIEKSWTHLEELATTYLGEVPVKEVRFDPSKRLEVDTAIIKRVLKENL